MVLSVTKNNIIIKIVLDFGDACNVIYNDIYKNKGTRNFAGRSDILYFPDTLSSENKETVDDTDVLTIKNIMNHFDYNDDLYIIYDDGISYTYTIDLESDSE